MDRAILRRNDLSIEKMENRVHGKTVFMAVLFTAAVFIIGLKLLNPTTLQIMVDGKKIAVDRIPGVYTYVDALLLVVSSVLMGVSGMYMLFVDVPPKTAGKQALENRRKDWSELSKTLKDDELKLYDAIMESDGIASQSDLIEKTGLSKSNVSRSLDMLESKGLVEKRRRGMGNVVLLK